MGNGASKPICLSIDLKLHEKYHTIPLNNSASGIHLRGPFWKGHIGYYHAMFIESYIRGWFFEQTMFLTPQRT